MLLTGFGTALDEIVKGREFYRVASKAKRNFKMDTKNSHIY